MYNHIMQDLSLQPLIRQYVKLKNAASGKGWYTCKCKVCDDYKVRAGFAFKGNETTYHCFNCNHVAKHNPDEHLSISDNMQSVLDSFGVPDDEYKALVLEILRNNYTRAAPSKKAAVKSDPDTKLVEIEFPKYFVPLSTATDTWAIIAKEYLQYDRGIDPEIYPFHILDNRLYDRSVEYHWRGRLITPYYRNSSVIWYQGRDLRPGSKFRYLNADTMSECILSDYEILNKDFDRNLYICEGFFDSICIGGTAIFGNTFKVGQMKLLSKSPRPKVFIPDRYGNGHIAANQAIAAGWAVSFPDVGTCKDVNEAIVKYGKLYVMKSIEDNVLYGSAAQIAVNTLCKRSK
jgi:hypothetical protein